MAQGKAQQPFEPMVLIPYRQLVDLLDTPRQLQRVEAALRDNEQQLRLLRTQYVEALLKIRELERMI